MSLGNGSGFGAVFAPDDEAGSTVPPAAEDQAHWMASLQTRPPVPASYWLLLLVFLAAAILTLALGAAETGTVVLLCLVSVPILAVARRMAGPLDSEWLPNVIILGWAAKLVASGGRYWALQVLYNGVGDATGYHGAGIRNSALFRTLQPPSFDTGTGFVDWFTGLLYVPYVPTKLGGFFLFATLAFFGQVLLYAAVRHAFPSSRLKWHALLLFFYVNTLYWPSSIGKESLMLLFIGTASYGIARLLSDYRPRWILVIGAGTALAGVIRSHMALLIILAAAIAMIVGRRPKLPSAAFRRIVSIVGVVAVGAGVVSFVISDFGIDVSAGISDSLVEEELDPIFQGVENQTDKGGSAVEGGAIRAISDVPEAFLRVLFRPLPYEAHNAQALANSLLEGTLLALLFLWRAPAIIRNFRRRWRDPYLTFALAYVAGFVFGHSAVLNLGIMARQRSQAIPFVVLLLVELGAPAIKKQRESREGDTSTLVQRIESSKTISVP